MEIYCERVKDLLNPANKENISGIGQPIRRFMTLFQAYESENTRPWDLSLTD